MQMATSIPMCSLLSTAGLLLLVLVAGVGFVQALMWSTFPISELILFNRNFFLNSKEKKD